MFNKLCNKFNITRAKSQKIRLTTSLVLILSIFCGTINAYADSLTQIRLVVDGKWNIYRTAQNTVEGFLNSENIKLEEKDILDMPIQASLEDDMVIYLDTAENIKFVIDGKEEVSFKTNQNKIGTALDEFKTETNSHYYLEEGQSSASPIVNDIEIKITTTKEEIKVITEEINFEAIYEENPNLPAGTENIKVAGVKGSKEIKTSEIYKNNQLDSKKIIEETVINEPVSQVIEKGTKANTVKTENGTFVINNKINMKSTAYTAGVESTGKKPGDKGYGITASGMQARKGVVAVDTKVIPFGTELYIEGYGYAIAGDTGGAIKGNKVDVFLDNYSDAIQYGVKYVDVYVLGDKIS